MPTKRDISLIDRGTHYDVPLPHDRFAKVCKCHAHLVMHYCWSFNGDYAMRMEERRVQYMHRLVVAAIRAKQVDHINCDRLDNRCTNLRAVTLQENTLHRSRYDRNTSGYKGVDFSRGAWRARISKGGRRLELGTFKTSEEAAHAYDRAAEQYHGRFAVLNFKNYAY